MATPASIREGLKTRLDTIAGLQASAYMLANPTPPAAHVFPAEITYDQAMGRGQDGWMMTVQAFVGFATDIGAQKRLDKLLASSGADSVKAAIEGDRTLGGVVQHLRVTRAGGYQIFLVEGRAPVLGAEWTVEILATG